MKPIKINMYKKSDAQSIADFIENSTGKKFIIYLPSLEGYEEYGNLFMVRKVPRGYVVWLDQYNFDWDKKLISRKELLNALKEAYEFNEQELAEIEMQKFEKYWP